VERWKVRVHKAAAVAAAAVVAEAAAAAAAAAALALVLSQTLTEAVETALQATLWLMDPGSESSQGDKDDAW
jgi:hypothetical protein